MCVRRKVIVGAQAARCGMPVPAGLVRFQIELIAQTPR
jgi:hypothetical protein